MSTASSGDEELSVHSQPDSDMGGAAVEDAAHGPQQESLLGGDGWLLGGGDDVDESLQHLESEFRFLELPGGGRDIDQEITAFFGQDIIPAVSHVEWIRGGGSRPIEIELVVKIAQRRASRAGRISVRVAALDDEVVDHPVKGRAVIKTGLRQRDDSVRRPGCLVLKQLEGHVPGNRRTHRVTLQYGDAQAAVPFRNFCDEAPIVARHAEGQRIVIRVGSVERDVDGRTGIERDVSNRSQRRRSQDDSSFQRLSSMTSSATRPGRFRLSVPMEFQAS